MMDPDPAIPELEKLHRESFAWSLVCCRGDREEAEEVLQTTYLKILDGRARHEGLGDLKPWLFAVIRRTAIGRRRRAVLSGLRRVAAPPTPHPGADGTNPEREALRSDQARRIHEALATLAQRQRQALELVFYHGLSLRQAAGVMSISLGAVRTHYHRGKRRLLAEIEKGGRR